MKLVTWNCQGAFRKKSALIAKSLPDIAVIQECECLEKLKWRKGIPPPTASLWFGENPSRGIGVFSWTGFAIEAHEPYDSTIHYCAPVKVTGASPFHLLAVWTKDHPKRQLGYSSQAYMATIVYKEFISNCHTVMVGDLNSNKGKDRAARIGSYTQLVQTLHDLGLVSAYHWFCRDRHGQERVPTFFLHRDPEKPAHIDYQFIPHAWTQRLSRVWIGAPQEWLEVSDHCPVFIEVAEKKEKTSQDQRNMKDFQE
jgi:exodeoxyribonuclease-3